MLTTPARFVALSNTTFTVEPSALKVADLRIGVAGIAFKGRTVNTSPLVKATAYDSESTPDSMMLTLQTETTMLLSPVNATERALTELEVNVNEAGKNKFVKMMAALEQAQPNDKVRSFEGNVESVIVAMFVTGPTPLNALAVTNANLAVLQHRVRAEMPWASAVVRLESIPCWDMVTQYTT